MSFDLFAYRQLKDTAADCEDRWDQIEKQMRQADGGTGSMSDVRYRFKQSKDFVAAVEGFLVELEDRLVDFKDVKCGKMEKRAEDILHMFYFRFQNIPLLSRMDAVMEYFIDEYETLCGCDIQEEERQLVQEKFRSMYVTRDLCQIYNWLLEEYGFEPLADLPRDERILAYEDVYPLLYLKYRLYTTFDHQNIRHLVIDEMQDYSYLQYVILEKMFSCNMTILGDRAQTVDDQAQDVLTFLPKLLGKKVRKIELNRSYRNTYEIAEYAGKIAGIQGIEYMKRHRRDVEELECMSRQAAAESILDRVKLDVDGYETAAILAMTEKEAHRIYEAIRARYKETAYIDRDSESFHKGITVTTYYMAKGLEFDQVFVAGQETESPFFRQFMYICATRALHELYVLNYPMTEPVDM